MERFIPLFYIVSWFGLVFGASYLINWLLIRSVIRRFYRFFVAPGVIVHELSHAIGCLVTGAQIVEINFWKSTGGHVKHYQPKMGLPGEAIIALAPIWGTFLVLFGLTWYVAPSTFTSLGTYDLASIAGAFDWASVQSWLYLYIVTSLVATIAPSKTDMSYALASLAVGSVLLIFLLMIPGIAELLASFGATVKPFAVFTIALMTLALLIAFILALPNRRKHFAARGQIE